VEDEKTYGVADAERATPPDYLQAVSDVLSEEYAKAEVTVHTGDFLDVQRALGDDCFAAVKKLGDIRHAARGVALTLCAYKAVVPSQGIRYHKADHEGGFAGRSIDAGATVPFLMQHGLTYNVETHWLSQTFSFAGPYLRGTILKTQPKAAGPLLVDIVNRVEEAAEPHIFALSVVRLLLCCLIEERNQGKIDLEKPKDLTIDQVISLLSAHFDTHYEKNAPRLPQLALYAIYGCIVASMERYQGQVLAPLERMKAANRKSGSVGDVDVLKADQPVESVEVKFGKPVSIIDVNEAIQKIKSKTVERYLILSTAGVEVSEVVEIEDRLKEFKRTNGCEIIVNGVLESIKYYLRLIRSSTDFILKYTLLVEKDADLGYEHRVAWNKVCQERLS
jgi:DNA (cytosine-5)-methyltransferase 1